jgi:hypothetical protein
MGQQYCATIIVGELDLQQVVEHQVDQDPCFHLRLVVVDPHLQVHHSHLVEHLLGVVVVGELLHSHHSRSVATRENRNNCGVTNSMVMMSSTSFINQRDTSLQLSAINHLFIINSYLSSCIIMPHLSYQCNVSLFIING